MSSGAPGDNASQHAAARSLIEQMVSNSDLHDEDAQEQQRLQDARQQDGYDDEQDRRDEEEEEYQQRPQYDDEEGDDRLYAAAAGSSESTHHDQVQAAFDNYGQITEEILAEWKEMFSLFDFDSTGFIKTDDLGTVLRGLGRNLTEAVIGVFINSYDANGSGRLDFPTFYRLLCDESPMPGPCHEQQVLADFHVFDMHRDGTLPVVDLVHLLRNLGEPLTRDDVDHLLQEIYIDGDNKVTIADLVSHMFRTSAPQAD